MGNRSKPPHNSHKKRVADDENSQEMVNDGRPKRSRTQTKFIYDDPSQLAPEKHKSSRHSSYNFRNSTPEDPYHPSHSRSQSTSYAHNHRRAKRFESPDIRRSSRTRTTANYQEDSLDLILESGDEFESPEPRNTRSTRSQRRRTSDFSQENESRRASLSETRSESPKRRNSRNSRDAEQTETLEDATPKIVNKFPRVKLKVKKPVSPDPIDGLVDNDESDAADQPEDTDEAKINVENNGETNGAENDGELARDLFSPEPAVEAEENAADDQQDFKATPPETESELDVRPRRSNRKSRIPHSDSDFDDNSASNDEVEEEEEDLEIAESSNSDDNSHLRYSKRLRSMQKRKSTLSSTSKRKREEEDDNVGFSLRPRKRLDYRAQMMPQRISDLDRIPFEPTLEEEDQRVRDERIFDRAQRNLSKTKVPKMKLAAFLGTENEEETDKKETFDLTIYGLPPTAAISGNLAPINVGENLKAREKLYMDRLSEDERKLYEKTKLSEDIVSGVPKLENKTTFQDIGGLKNHIVSLKEMVVIPLLYPELVGKLNPPKGVLMYGPPGTGKTMIVRALATTCSSSNRPTALFMRKGADLLSKWLGESESQLMQLFEQAKIWQPSIIFFDELDGLAPARSGKNDHVHTSIVSTLLTLMDGLDNRGQVVVIGATNRIDAIDPALLRPGRFDRRIYFPLPDPAARKEIIEMVTKSWNGNTGVSEEMKSKLVELTNGFCGADLKALGTEAMLAAVRRTFPQILESDNKLLINPDEIQVTLEDVEVSLHSIVPSSSRNFSIAPSHPLPPTLLPLLQSSLTDATKISNAAAKRLQFSRTLLPSVECIAPTKVGGFNRAQMLLESDKPRVLICGEPGMGQVHVAAAVIEGLEKSGFQVVVIDEIKVNSDVMVQESIILAAFEETLHNRPKSILFVKNLDAVWDLLSAPAQSAFTEKISSLVGVLILATINMPKQKLEGTLKNLFARVTSDVVEISSFTSDQRSQFFTPYIDSILNAIPLNQPKFTNKVSKELPLAPALAPLPLTDTERNALEAAEFHQLVDLRIGLREITKQLLSAYRAFKQFDVFCLPETPESSSPTEPKPTTNEEDIEMNAAEENPVDEEPQPEPVVKKTKIKRVGLQYVQQRIDDEYLTPEDWMNDINEMTEAVLNGRLVSKQNQNDRRNDRRREFDLSYDANALKDLASKLVMNTFSNKAVARYQMIKARRMAKLAKEKLKQNEEGKGKGKENVELDTVIEQLSEEAMNVEVVPMTTAPSDAATELANGGSSSSYTISDAPTIIESESSSHGLVLEEDASNQSRKLTYNADEVNETLELLVQVTDGFSLEEMESVGTKLAQILMDLNDQDDRSVVVEEFKRVCELLQQML